MRRLIPVVALTAAALTLSVVGARAQESGTVLAALNGALAADAGFSPAQRSQLSQALADRFADYGVQGAASRRAAVNTALSMIGEGALDEQAPERIADVAFAAYQAVNRGAPPDVVEGIGLYGYRKKIAADRLSTWANGYQQMAAAGVPPAVAADLVRATMEGDWDDSAFDTLKWALVGAAKARFDQRAFATYLLGHMQEPGAKPGALSQEAQSYFKKLAKTGEKPVLPKYEGVFTPKPRLERVPSAPAETRVAEPPRRNPKISAPERESPPASSGDISAMRRKSPEKAAEEPVAGTAAFDSLWPRLQQTAFSYLGTPYVWGGVTHRGIDCSALTQNTYGENDVRIPRVSRDQWRAGSQVEEQRWRRGDLVFFNTLGKGVSHVGMIVDPEGPKFIHASSSRGVMVADLSKNYFRTRYLGARRVVP